MAVKTDRLETRPSAPPTLAPEHQMREVQNGVRVAAPSARARAS